MTDFRMAHVESGKVEYKAGSENSNEAGDTFQVTFDKIFEGTPSVHCSIENSSKKAIAHNVSSTGFQIIISDSGFDTGESIFLVHYYAFYIK